MPERLRNDAAARLFAFATVLTILAAWVAGRAARDALFLSTFPVKALPWMMLASAAVSLGSAVGLARLMTRFGPARVVPAAFATSAALFLAEWMMARTAPSLAPVALYLHLGALGALLISGFFSVLSERWDPYAAKTVVSRAGAFGALGGVIGGIAAERAGALGVGVAPMLLSLAAAHALCALGVAGIGAPSSPLRPTGSLEAGGGLAILRRTSLLRSMAMLAVLIGVVEALLDFALKAAAAEQLGDEAALIRFFALFEMSVGALAFLVQIALGGRILHRFGLGWAMALRPAMVMVAALGGALFARFAAVVLARAADVVTMRSTYNAGFQLLYTSLPPETKRPTKPFVDVVANRVGDMAGAGLVLVLIAALPVLPQAAVLALAALVSGLALFLIARTQRRYVRQLATNLKAGAITLQDDDTLDAVTSRTVFGTSGEIDRDELMAQIQAARAGQAQQQAESQAAAVAPGGAPALEGARRDHFARIESLESGDPARVRATLNGARGDARLAQYVIPLLRDGPSADPALVFLRSIAPRVVGQLNDALADLDQDLGVRRRIPRALEVCRNARTIGGLREGLQDDDFEVRVSCARAAARIIARQPELRLSASEAERLAQRELARDAREGDERRGAHDDPVLLDRLEAPRVSLRLEHLFTLLSLGLGGELMTATLRSLHSGNTQMRGTALEYLQTTLPDGLRAALWRQIPGAGGSQPTPRPAKQITEELLNTSMSLRLTEEES